MELKHLLSLATAAMTALGAILYSMGSQHAVLAVGLWLAAVLSLVLTDFLGLLRLPRNVGLVLMWAALAWFLPQFLIQATLNGRLNLVHSPDWQLQTVASILICLQCTLLFQEKDARTYGWLILMSLLQVVVAARYSRGFAFGSLLVVYGAIGIVALSLLSLYAHRGRADREPGSSRKERHSPAPDSDAPPCRWPLGKVETGFISSTAGGGRLGIVPELFGRLALLIAGAAILAAVIFYTVPRPWIRAWRSGEANKSVALVGFNERIELGSLGETIESREEVMRVRLLDPATRKPYPLTDEIYLRGEVVTRYAQNHWRRFREGQWSTDELDDEADSRLQLGSPVIQRITLEPYLDRNELFYIWPLVVPVSDRPQGIIFTQAGERLQRMSNFSGEPYTREFTFELQTSGLVNGQQAPLIPARREMDVSSGSPLLEMPRGRDALPRLTALASRWRREAHLKTEQRYEIARHFERQFSSSGQFQYSLEGEARDESIDAIEDFVSNHPRGHCEYFATALALMLRSQGIPSHVVLGYRCDEWDPGAHCFQVRQLHAHAWVEVFLSPELVPDSLRHESPERWQFGGWLRLDGTPAADVGSAAANRTAWGAWEARWHSLQHYWENDIADMDRTKQQESVYGPLRRALREFASGLLSPAAWRATIAAGWATLARAMQSGIMGKLFGMALLLAAAGLFGLLAWGVAIPARRWWRRLVGRGNLAAARARTSVEFYRRFEQLAARHGLLRGAGQTPREFACVAGAKLANEGGRPELRQLAMQVAEAFYRVRFGRRELDAAAAEEIAKALEDLRVSIKTGRDEERAPSRH